MFGSSGGGGGMGGPMSMGASGMSGMGGALGGAIGGLFNNMSGANNSYRQYMDQAQQTLQQHEATGRGDITGYYNKAQGFGDPYRTAGAGALGAYQQSLGLGGQGGQNAALSQFRASPGYQFALQQGLQGVQRGMAAHGLSGSGAEMRALQSTGQGLANQEYGQYQNRLANLAGMGQQEAARSAQMAYGTGGQLASLGGQYAPQLSNLDQQRAQAEYQIGAQQGQKPGQIGGSIGSLAGLAMYL